METGSGSVYDRVMRYQFMSKSVRSRNSYQRRFFAIALFVLLSGLSGLSVPLRAQSGDSAETVIFYPQLVVGQGFETILILSNSSAQAWTGSLRVDGFGAGSGVNWSVNGAEQTGRDSFQFSLPAFASDRLIFSSSQATASAGPLEIRGDSGSSTDDLAATFFYNFRLDGRLVDAIGIAPAVAARTIVIPVEISQQRRLDTGIAVRRLAENLNPAADSQPGFEMLLFDRGGTLIAQRSVSFFEPRFFSELFEQAVEAAGGEFLGSVRIESDRALYATALRQQLFDDGGFQLTGVPPLTRQEKVSFGARYEVTFEATWSASTHPMNFPSGAHFSGLIGGTHNSEVAFWEPGLPASAGIQNMAETGSKSPLMQEVEQAIGAGSAGLLISGGGLSATPGSVGVTVDVTRSYPLVTLVSMIAPSPDWFVGVHGLSLINDGQWLDELTVELFPYDAGTDSGSVYTSANQATIPAQSITRITGAPFLSGSSVLPLGRFVFRRIDSAGQ